MNTIKRIAAFLLLLATAWPMQQKSNQKQDKNAPKQQSEQNPQSQDASKQQSQSTSSDQQPAPLFQGQSNLKSSRQGKDVAVMGFNGIGPNGQVEKKMLDASANADDEQKAAKMSAYTVSSADVTAFAQEGKLNSSSKGGK